MGPMYPGWLQGGQNLNMGGMIGAPQVRPGAPAAPSPGSTLNLASMIGPQAGWGVHPPVAGPYEPFPQPTPVRGAPVRPVGPSLPAGGVQPTFGGTVPQWGQQPGFMTPGVTPARGGPIRPVGVPLR